MAYDDEGDHEVGYGKPPRHSQFVKGQSGNPRGRPAGAKNLKTLLSKALNELVIVTENGGQRKISKREAIVTQLVNRSAQADLKAIQILLAMLRDIEGHAEAGAADADLFTEADQQIIQRTEGFRLEDHLGALYDRGQVKQDPLQGWERL
jgi:Family of unknown function (DUF5681)